MFKPMLAGTLPLLEDKKYDFSKVKFPVFVSPKLDGVRATIQGGKVLSRTLKPIPNQYVQQLYGKPEFEGLDGELISGDPTHKNAFQNTMSAVMTMDGNPDVRLHVFDWFHHQADFSFRYKALQNLCSGENWVEVLHQVHVDSPEELYGLEAQWLFAGYEGMMIRSIKSPYKQGRSTLNEGWLLKLKRFEDSEAVVLEFVEQLRNENEAVVDALGHMKRSTHQDNKVPSGTLGALMVRDLKTGVEFKIGAGWDEKECKKIWEERSKYIGKIIKYKSQVIGMLNKPRQPICLGWRDEKDIS